MSDSTRVSLRYVKETTPGVTPASPTLTAIRFTTEDLAFEPVTVESQEQRSDAQIDDLPLVNQRGAGPINFEWSYKSQDWLIQAALRGGSFAASATATDNGSTIELAITVSGSTIVTSSGATGYDWVANGFSVGKWVRLKGWTTNAGKIYGKISAVTTTELTLTHCTLQAETGPTNCEVMLGEEIVNGTTIDQYSIQREYADLTNEFTMFTGFGCNGLSFDVNAEGIVTGTATMLGMSEASATSAPSGFSNAVSAGDGNPVFNATSNVPLVYVAGGSFPVKSFQFSVDPGLRERTQVGTLGAASLGGGRTRATGNKVSYYASKTEYDKLSSQTASSVAIGFQDASGNGALWEFPKTKYSTAKRGSNVTDGDVMLDMTWQALRHTTENITVRYVRWDT